MTKNTITKGIILSSLLIIPFTSASADEVRVVSSAGSTQTGAVTKSVDYTVNLDASDNALDLKKILNEGFQKNGVIFKFLENESLPVGFVFESMKKLLSISKDEAVAGEYVLPYEMCIEKVGGLNDLGFEVSPQPPTNSTPPAPPAPPVPDVDQVPPNPPVVDLPIAQLPEPEEEYEEGV